MAYRLRPEGHWIIQNGKNIWVEDLPLLSWEIARFAIDEIEGERKLLIETKGRYEHPKGFHLKQKADSNLLQNDSEEIDLLNVLYTRIRRVSMKLLLAGYLEFQENSPVVESLLVNLERTLKFLELFETFGLPDLREFPDKSGYLKHLRELDENISTSLTSDSSEKKDSAKLRRKS